MNAVRGEGPLGQIDLESEILTDVSVLLSRLADKSDRLITNSTTNLAEAWMNIRAKFDGGKYFNRCNRGSWHARCYGGALRLNLGTEWSPKVWEHVTGTPATLPFKDHYRQRTLRHTSSLKSQAKEDVKARSRKRKMKSLSISQTKKAKRSYGPEHLEVCPDVSSKRLDEMKSEYLEREVKVTMDHSRQIEHCTRGQSSSQKWYTHRHKRLTSSRFGDVMKRRLKTPVNPLVRSILYPSFKGNEYTRHGLSQEKYSIDEYVLRKAENGMNAIVRQSGLVIDDANSFLAGSPDGIVTMSNGDKGLLEVKNLLKNKRMSLYQAARNKSFCLQDVKGKLCLRSNHQYYYQVQGLLNITKLPWLDFVVRTTNPHQLHIERIHRNSFPWTNVMLPKLTAFYMSCLLPELSSPREGKYPGIREPGPTWVKLTGNSIFKKFLINNL